MRHTLYELRVTLRNIEPPIWRTVELPGISTLEDVHFALQVAMGWTNSHLHQFLIDGETYGMINPDEPGDLEFEDECEYALQDLVEAGDSFVYEYDFGDGWEHDITVAKVTSVAKEPHARCIAGARACPPEDCGGPPGYDNLLQALANPDHPEHQAMVTWSNKFKPEAFVVPKRGLDLRDAMLDLQMLADDEDPDDPPIHDLPQPLVQAVLALDPMQRASLGALILGSLATDLVEVRDAAGQLVTAMRDRDKKKAGRPHRRRART